MCFVYEGNNLANPVPTKERKNVTQKQYGGQTENMQRWTSVVFFNYWSDDGRSRTTETWSFYYLVNFTVATAQAILFPLYTALCSQIRRRY